MLTQICNERVGGCWSKGYTYILQTAQDTLDIGLKKKAIKVIMEGSGGGSLENNGMGNCKKKDYCECFIIQRSCQN